MADYHEPREALSAKTLDIKRAIDSMREELEAVDWYRQRMEAATDESLKALLDHHQREEVEHFAMLLEWVRRNDRDFAEQLKTYLFTERDIIRVEEEEQGPALRTGGRSDGAPKARGTTIGSLKGALP